MTDLVLDAGAIAVKKKILLMELMSSERRKKNK